MPRTMTDPPFRIRVSYPKKGKHTHYGRISIPQPVLRELGYPKRLIIDKYEEGKYILYLDNGEERKTRKEGSPEVKATRVSTPSHDSSRPEISPSELVDTVIHICQEANARTHNPEAGISFAVAYQKIVTLIPKAQRTIPALATFLEQIVKNIPPDIERPPVFQKALFVDLREKFLNRR